MCHCKRQNFHFDIMHLSNEFRQFEKFKIMKDFLCQNENFIFAVCTYCNLYIHVIGFHLKFMRDCRVEIIIMEL